MRALPIAFLLLLACNPPQPPTCSTTPFAPAALLLTDEPATVRVALQTVCFDQMGRTFGDPKPATDVKVEVFDPDNHAVPFTTNGVQTGPSDAGFVASDTFVDVTFTPTIDGPYSVSGQFEPSKGRVQAIFNPVRKRTDGGVRVLPTTLPTDCTQYGLLGDDLVCVHPGTTGFVELAAGGAAFPGEQFLVGDDALWVVSGPDGARKIDRLGRDAGTFVKTHGMTTSAGSLMIAPDGDGGLWTIEVGLMRRLAPVADGTLEVALQRGSSNVPFAIAGTPDRMIALTRSSFQAVEIVSFQRDGGFSTQAANRQVDFAWSDTSQLWLSSNQNFGAPPPVDLSVVDAPGTATRVAVLGTVNLMSLPGTLSPACPVIADGIGPGRPLVPLNDVGGPRFETFDPGPGYFPVTSANARHAFARSKDGKTVKVFDR